MTDLNILELTGTASIGGVYTVSGTQYTQFLTLIGLSSEAAAYWSTGTFRVTSSGFSYSSTSGWYGGFTVTVSDIGTTIA